MPYSDVTSLPAPVRAKLKGKKLRQWMHVFNSSYDAHKDESRAFAEAWAAVKKVDSVEKREKISKEKAGYQAYPQGTDRCNICTMFLPLHSCTLVKGAVSANGWCEHFDPKEKSSALGKAQTMTDFNFFMPIAKVSREADGTCIVSGYASTPTKDSDGEIVTLNAIKKALPDYMRWRNIREMHQLKAVGKAQEATIDRKGLWLSAKISDPVAVQKCVDEVYQGFSIGGRKLDTDGNKVNEIELTEISVVDRPANPDCRISIAKSATAATKDDGGFLVEPPPKLTAEQKALKKMAKIVGTLAGVNPPAAHDGFSLPAKTAANKSPKDPETQNNKAEGGKEKCAAHGVEDCQECLDKRQFTEDKRNELASSGKALPDGSYPIENVGDLKNAISAFGRAKDKGEAKAHIISRAKALGAEKELPEKWTTDKKAQKAAKAHLRKAFAIDGESFLVLRKSKAPELDKPIAEPLAKGMGTAGSLAYCFDSIRNAQRSLMVEAKREGGDMKDKGLAKELGSIAQRLASVISQKAEHEGGEATTLTDIDDQYLTSILGEDFDMNKTQKTVGGSGDPLTDAMAALMKRATTPSRAMRMTMAKDNVRKARKAAKAAREAIEEAHKMCKAAYIAKAAKKPDGKDDDGDFDHAGMMEKLQKAFGEINKVRTFGKAAEAQIKKASARAGQRGQEAGDADAGFYEVPPGVKNLSPAAIASASPGGDGAGSQPPLYPGDGSVYAGKGADTSDLRKFAKDGNIPVEVANLIMEKAKTEGELAALRATAGAGGRQRPYAFDLNKIVAGTGSGGNAELNKTLFDGVNPMALGSNDERAHTEASARVIGNFLTSGHFGKSVFDPAFKGAAGSNS